MFSIKYLPFIVNDGRITAVVKNTVVCSELLREVSQWNAEGANIDDVIEQLRLRTVPSNYTSTIHSWTEGM